MEGREDRVLAPADLARQLDDGAFGRLASPLLLDEAQGRLVVAGCDHGQDREQDQGRTDREREGQDDPQSLAT